MQALTDPLVLGFGQVGEWILAEDAHSDASVSGPNFCEPIRQGFWSATSADEMRAESGEWFSFGLSNVSDLERFIGRE